MDEARPPDLKRGFSTDNLAPRDTPDRRLVNYVKPVPVETILEQVRLAVRECSQAEFTPDRFQESRARTAWFKC